MYTFLLLLPFCLSIKWQNTLIPLFSNQIIILCPFHFLRNPGTNLLRSWDNYIWYDDDIINLRWRHLGMKISWTLIGILTKILYLLLPPSKDWKCYTHCVCAHGLVWGKTHTFVPGAVRITCTVQVRVKSWRWGYFSQSFSNKGLLHTDSISTKVNGLRLPRDRVGRVGLWKAFCNRLL